MNLVREVLQENDLYQGLPYRQPARPSFYRRAGARIAAAEALRTSRLCAASLKRCPDTNRSSPIAPSSHCLH